MADIQLRSLQQILGQMASKMMAETNLNDLSPGSFFLTLLEAAASSDFTQEGKLLQLLNLRNPDKAKGIDLENLAEEMGLDPPRIGAESSSVELTITDSSFDKISTSVFAGAVSPAAGDLALKVNDATDFSASGTIFVGRGTSTSEAITYVSKTDNGTYWAFNLSGPLTKDHLVGEEVILAQGGDRTILSGTIARVPASAGNPAIEFSISSDSIIPDGEKSLSGILATALNPGIVGNVGIGRINEFSSPPFSSASVSNDVPASGGSDAETDPELRQRIKDHVHELGRGTQRAIIRTVVGVSDPDQNNKVVSAFLREPTEVGDLGILFIDDGTGFSPTFAGVGEEEIITNASGTEQFFQLQKFPLVKAQIVSIGIEPFVLSGGERLLFEVDGISEEKVLSGDSYRSPGVVSAQEVVEVINKTFTTIEARARDGRLFVTPVKDDPDYIRAGVPTSNNANAFIRFPTRKQFTITLYKNDEILEKSGSNAFIQSFPSSQWPPFSSSETLQLMIDGIESPVITFTDSDFFNLTSSSTISSANPLDWAIVINAKFIGITAVAQDDGTVVISSNKGKVIEAQVSVLDGTLADTFISSTASGEGKSAQFLLNRLLGQVEYLGRLENGDNLKAGNTLTAGFVLTDSQASFDFSTVLGSPAQLSVITDAPAEIIAVDQTISVLTFSAPDAQTQRIAGAVGQFSNVNPDDWIFLYNLPRSGQLRVKSVAVNGSSIDCFDPNPQSGSDTPNTTTKIMVIFRTEGFPQVITLPVGSSVSVADTVTSLNAQISGGKATLLDNSQIRIETLRLDGEGALAIPVIAGNANNLGFDAGSFESNDPHTAAIESADLAGIPSGRLTINTADLSSPYDDLKVNGTPFNTDLYHNRPVYFYLGSSSRLIREPLEKLSTSELTLRDDIPLQVMEIGTDSKLTTSAGLEVSESDNMVFIIDDDAAKKTFDIPMYVDATVASPSVPTTTEFDAEDAVGDLLGSSARWLGHRFEDYRVWFKARYDVPASVPNTQMRISSQLFGPTGKKIDFGIFYPTAPASDAAANYTIDTTNQRILVNLFLGSGSEKVIGLTVGAPVFVDVTGPTLGVYAVEIQFIPPVDLSTLVPGDVLSLSDANFDSTNLGQMNIETITNLSDVTRSYEHLEETIDDTTISGGINFTLGSTPASTLRVGDKMTAVSISRLATNTTVNTITVGTGAPFAAGGGSVVSNAQTFTYTSYAAGVFSGVSPDPTAIISFGDTVTQTITPFTETINSVATQTTGTITGGFVDGGGYDMLITHVALTSDLPPSFTAAVGDKIQVASQLLTITGIYSTTEFAVDTPFTFTGSELGTISRLILTGTRTSGTDETVLMSSAQGVRVITLDPANTTNSLIDVINSTAGVNDLIFASNVVGSDGTGIVITSTADELGDGDSRVSLLNGESFMYSTGSSSPALRLKVPSDVAPELGEAIKLIPMTPQNVTDHFNRKQISGLSIASDVSLVNGSRHVQIATKTPGGIGQVFAVGGKASGNNTLGFRNSGQEISSSIGVMEMDRAALDLIAPNHTIFISQTGRAKKNFVGSSPISSTNAEIQIFSATTARLIFGVPLAATRSYTHTGSVVWSVRRLPRGRLRFEVLSGTASLPGSLIADDFVLVGNGTSYAGSTPTQFFTSANSGYFQIRSTDASTYFDVDAVGTEEYVTASSAPFVFIPYHSAMIGDQISIGADSPFSTPNQGTYVISAIESTTQILYANANSLNEGPSALGAAGVDSIRVLDSGYSTYRTVSVIAPKPSDPTNRSILVVNPGYNISLFNESQQAKITFPNRLGFATDPVPGISGYQYWTGLKARVQKTLDGYEPDSTNFPGVRAAGVAIEAREPQITRVSMIIKIKTKQGVALASISDSIKSSVIGFINSLGLGQDVILSEIVSIVQSTAGVDSVVLVNPTLDTERITISDNSIARSSNSEIVLS